MKTGDYTIGQVARMAGVPTTTVRYYERAGLVRPDARTGRNYRIYGPASLLRLRFVRTCQRAGVSLEDVKLLIDLADTAKEPCTDVQKMLRRRLADIDTRIEQLRQVQQRITIALQACRCERGGGLCRDIGNLRQGP